MNINEFIPDIEKLVDYKVELHEIEGVYELIRFYNIENDENNGIYNCRLKKIIIEDTGNISNINYNDEFCLVEYYSWRTHGKHWIDLEGNRVLTNAEIIKELSFDCYLIEQEEEKFDKTQTYKSKYLYCVNPSNFSEDIDNFNKILIANVEDVTPNENGNILLVETLQNSSERKIGVFDLKNLKWIHELAIIPKSDSFN
jgi:hypothetical protein